MRKIKAFLVLFLAIMIVSFCAISSGASNVGIEEYYEYDAETGEETIFSLPAASLSTYARSPNETIEWDENGNIISRSTPPYDPDVAEGVSVKIASKIAPLAKTSNADDYTKVTNTRAFPYKCIGYILVVKGYDSNGNEKRPTVRLHCKVPRCCLRRGICAILPITVGPMKLNFIPVHILLSNKEI